MADRTGGFNRHRSRSRRLLAVLGTIARALVRKPPIYLLDDSFSAPDHATNARLRAALRPATTDADTTGAAV